MTDSGWSVGLSRHQPGVIYLNLGAQKVILPALEGLKMGVALKVAGEQALDPTDIAGVGEVTSRVLFEEVIERIRERSCYGDYAEARNRLFIALDALQDTRPEPYSG